MPTPKNLLKLGKIVNSLDGLERPDLRYLRDLIEMRLATGALLNRGPIDERPPNTGAVESSPAAMGRLRLEDVPSGANTADNPDRQ